MHQGVVWSTYEITPKNSFLSSSFWTLFRNGDGTCQGVYIENGLDSGMS